MKPADAKDEYLEANRAASHIVTTVKNEEWKKIEKDWVKTRSRLKDKWKEYVTKVDRYCVRRLGERGKEYFA